MPKKRILVMGLLLVLSIAGQLLLRPCLGENTITAPPAQAEPTTKSSLTEAAPAAEPEFAQDTPQLQSDLLQQFFYMLGFVAIIGIGAWLICKKLSHGWATGGQTIRVTETVRMGPRKTLHLIRVGKNTFLVGSTSDNFSLLADVSDSVTTTEVKSNEQ